MALLIDERSELVFATLDAFLAIADGVITPFDFRDAAVDLLRLLVEVLFLLLQAALGVLHLLATLLRLAVEVAAHLQQLLLDLQVRFLDFCFGGLAGIIENAVGVLPRLLQMHLGALVIDHAPERDQNDRAHDCAGNGDGNVCDVHNCSSPDREARAVGGANSEDPA